MFEQTRLSGILSVGCGLVLTGILFGILVATPARADVGVQPILPDGSNIQPKEETPIQISAEKVVFNVRQATEWDRAAIKFNPMAYELQNPLIPIWQLSVAEVTAVFTMTNPTSEAVSMIAWFPLASALENDEWENHIGEVAPRIESFQVAVDGKPLDYSVSELPNPKGGDKPVLPWASFPVTFAAGEETIIQVYYVLWAQPDISGVGTALHYVFQTGAGWAGSIGKAELVVKLPFPASEETIGAMPDGGQVEGHQVRWKWENLEPGPQDDFSIWLIRQERWEELETARIKVIEWPEDGEAWLNLADTYRRLILGKYRILPGFGETYQPLGVQAAQEAQRLLEEDGRPHYELAFFYLSALPENPSPGELQPVLDELRIVEELAPAYAGDVHDWMEFLLSEDQWISLNADWATETAEAAVKLMPSMTPTHKNLLTSTPIPSTTPEVLSTSNRIQPVKERIQQLSHILLFAASIVVLFIVGYLVLRRPRGRMR